ACAKMMVYFEWTLACSTHLANGSASHSESDTLRSVLNSSSSGLSVMGLGDFNLEPSSSHMGEWQSAGYVDALVGYTWTYEGNPHIHIDYSWFKTTYLAGPDPGGTAYSSASDHSMLWSPIHFK